MLPLPPQDIEYYVQCHASLHSLPPSPEKWGCCLTHFKTLSMPRARPKCSLQLDPSTIRRLHSHFCTSSLFFWDLLVLFLAFASPLHPIWFCAFLAKVRGWIPQGKMMKVWKDSHRIIKCQHTSPKGNRNANSWNLQRLENAHFLPLRMDLKICFPHPS